MSGSGIGGQSLRLRGPRPLPLFGRERTSYGSIGRRWCDLAPAVPDGPPDPIIESQESNARWETWKLPVFEGFCEHSKRAERALLTRFSIAALTTREGSVTRAFDRHHALGGGEGHQMR